MENTNKFIIWIKKREKSFTQVDFEEANNTLKGVAIEDEFELLGML